MRIDVSFRETGTRLNVGLRSGDAKVPVGFSGVQYLGTGGGTPGLPPGGDTGDIIIKRSQDDYDAEWVAPADAVEHGNKLPVTAAAVHAEISKINLTLATTEQINRLF